MDQLCSINGPCHDSKFSGGQKPVYFHGPIKTLPSVSVTSTYNMSFVTITNRLVTTQMDIVTTWMDIVTTWMDIVTTWINIHSWQACVDFAMGHCRLKATDTNTPKASQTDRQAVLPNVLPGGTSLCTCCACFCTRVFVGSVYENKICFKCWLFDNLRPWHCTRWHYYHGNTNSLP